VRDEADFLRLVDYVHFNPVKHGLVSNAKDWPFSSFSARWPGGIIQPIGDARMRLLANLVKDQMKADESGGVP